MNDLKFALRQLLKKPGFTAVAVLTIGLSIGANTTVYSWIKGTLIDVLPGVKDQDRLVVICPKHRGGRIADTCSYPDIQDFRQSTNIFSGVIGSQIGLAHVRIDNRLDWVWAQPISANSFEVLGLIPVLGRGFLPDEETKPGGHPVTVISYGFWRDKFGGRTNIIGETFEINQRPFTIVGIAPERFKGTMSGLRMDLWIPLMMSRALDIGSDNFQRRNERWAHTLARLRPHVTPKQAQAALDLLSKQSEAAYPDTNRNLGFQEFLVWKAPYGGQAALRSLLEALSAMTLLVLFIVIANLSSLQLVRASDRSKEIAVRLALGASRARILIQLLIESVLMAGVGGALGLFFSHASMDWLYRFMPKTYLPFGYEFKLDTMTLATAVLLAAVTGVLFGFAPAWQATRVNQIDALKEGGRSSSGGRNSLRSGFVIAEIALALVLLVCAGLAWQSFNYSRHLNVGLDPNNVLIAGLRLESHGFDEKTGQIFIRKLKHRLEETAGVQSVAAGNWLPLGFEGGSTTGLKVEGYVESPGELMSAGVSSVSSDYFRTFRIAVLQGREFEDRDRIDTPFVAIINEETARHYFAGRNPIGGIIRFAGADRRIVGVVQNGKYRSLNEPRQTWIYLPLEQNFEPHLGFAIRVPGDPYAFISHWRAAVKEIDPTVQSFTALSMIDYMGAAYLVPRIAGTLLAGLSAVALFLAVLGIYGVTSYVVSQRTREIGIRMALGATITDVYKLILQGGLKMALFGILGGLVLSFASARLMSNILVGVTATDPMTFVMVSILLLLAALLACFFPAHRAAKLDPMEALRNE